MVQGKQYSGTDVRRINGHQIQIWRTPNSLRFHAEKGGKISLPVEKIESMVMEERKKGNISITIKIPIEKEKDVPITFSCRFLARQVKLARLNM
ncbi:MAG: hypothetical protein AAB355_00685 [Patescibacteria group bacterium]